MRISVATGQQILSETERFSWADRTSVRVQDSRPEVGDDGGPTCLERKKKGAGELMRWTEVVAACLARPARPRARASAHERKLIDLAGLFCFCFVLFFVFMFY
jgi:hypothetical protein